MSFKKAFGAVLAIFCASISLPAHAEEFTRKSFLMPKGSFELTGDPALGLVSEPVLRYRIVVVRSPRWRPN